MDLLFEELQKANKNKKQTVVLSGSFENAKKLSKLLDEKNIKYILDEKLENDIFFFSTNPFKIVSVSFIIFSDRAFIFEASSKNII